jgi:small subunit ribosomal protein S7
MRHKRITKRKREPDFKYQNPQIGKFINYVMKCGKKSLAEKIVYGALDLVSQKTNAEPLITFEKALRNASPDIVVKARRIGGANYQIPVPAEEERKFVLATRWLIEAAREKKGRSMIEKLADEIMAAAKNEGSAIAKKEGLHKLAEANKAFAYFARFIK